MNTQPDHQIVLDPKATEGQPQSLSYVSSSAESLGLDNVYPKDWHVAAFVKVPLEKPPTIVAGVAAVNRDRALEVLSRTVWREHMNNEAWGLLLTHNQQAAGTAQMDIFNSAVGREEAEKAQAMVAMAERKFQEKDPLVQHIYEEVGCYFADLLHVLGVEKFDAQSIAMIQNMMRTCLLRDAEAWQGYLQNDAEAAVAGIRKQLDLPQPEPQDPN